MNTTKTDRLATDTKLLSGIKKHLGEVGLMIDGKPYKIADIGPILQKRIDTRGAVITTKAAYADAVLNDHVDAASTAAIVAKIRQALKIMFGADAEALADLGLTRRATRRPATVEDKSATVAKTKATRAARHTLGRRQRLRIHGAVVVPASPSPPNGTNGVNHAPQNGSAST
jgi:hypothetical protein